MEQASFFPDWRTLVRYAAPRPQPALLADSDGFRVLVAGLEPGGESPAHPERLAVYHVLEGQGEMTVDDNRYAVTAGSTVLAGRGSRRGIRATTRLAFLAVRIGPELESDD